MKEKLIYLETSKGKYPMSFNLNVMEEIQEQYGSMEAWGDIVGRKDKSEPKVKDLKNGLMIMINEGIDIENETKTEKAPFLSPKQVGRILTELGFSEIYNKIKEITVASAKSGEKEKNE